MIGYSIMRCESCEVGHDWFHGHLLTMARMVAADEGPLCRVCCEPLILFEQIKEANADRTC
jgi:hypothetical protein